MIQTARLLLPFCLLIFIAGCKKEKEIIVPFEKLKFPAIIDEMAGNQTELASATWLSYAHNQPLYFGKYQDTITVNRKLDYKSEFFTIGYAYGNVLTIDSAIVGIKVDLSQIINSMGLKSNPVLILNKSIDTLFIGAEERIYFLMEGKTKTGTWKPIEKHFFPICGTGVNSMILPPKNFAISSITKYNGNYKTKLRIKMGANYSNEFEGWINESQFESRLTADGKEKALPNNGLYEKP